MTEEKVTELALAQSPTSINDLRPGMELPGRVTKIDLYGAFVDIGIGKDALIHISKIRRERVNRVSDVLSVGDEVTTYVDRVDATTGRVTVSMIRPLAVPWHKLDVGQVYEGRITRVEKYGAFVDIGAERPGLVHISEMGDEMLRDPSDLFSVKDQVSVRVIQFDRRKRRIDLGLAGPDSEEVPEEEEDEEPALTAMEIALRKAMDDAEPDLDSGGGVLGNDPQRRQMQDDILSRTLRSRKT
jgi:ribosomal protein S1